MFSEDRSIDLYELGIYISDAPAGSILSRGSFVSCYKEVAQPPF